jgi:hypothetical protein
MVDHYRAYLSARKMVEHLLLAHAADPADYAAKYYEKQAVAELTRAAEELGYTLVAKEKADA